MPTAATTGRRACRFCGATGKLTGEHWLPIWTHALVDDGPAAPYVRATDDRIERTWQAPVGSSTVKQVCKGCNEGWMSDLEQRTKPILEPLLRGHVRTVSPAEQAVLATWAAKTILAADLTRPDPVAPDENRAWVRERGTPPDGVVVLLARYAGHRFPVYASGKTETVTVGAGDGRSRPWVTYLMSVSAGPVVLQMFGHGLANMVDFRPAGWKRDFAHVLWPDPSVVTWPLPRALGDDGLRRFVRDV